MIEKVQDELNEIFARTRYNLLEDIDWPWISRQYKFSREFIEEFHDKLDMEYLAIHDRVQKELDIIYKKYGWDTLFKVDWYLLLEKEQLSWELIDYYHWIINWVYVSEHTNISEAVIERYSDLVDWDKISRHQTLSPAFIEKHQDKLDINYLIQTQKIRVNVNIF